MGAWELTVVLLAGLGAGFANAVAGGGSLLTLPALMLVAGLPSHGANGTNRFAQVFLFIAGALTYHRRGVLPWRAAGPPAVAAGAGAVVGALVAQALTDEVFTAVIAVILLGLAVWLLLRRDRPATDDGEAGDGDAGGDAGADADAPAPPADVGATDPGAPPLRITLLVGVIGIYGGFLGPNASTLMILVLVGGAGLTYLQAAAAVQPASLAISVTAGAVYAVTRPTEAGGVPTVGEGGVIDYTLAIALAGSMMVGAWLGGGLASRVGSKWVRRAVVLVVIVAVARMAWDARGWFGAG